MQVYLDDKRTYREFIARLAELRLPPEPTGRPEGWMHVLWPHQAIDLLNAGFVTALSLDHDLGDVAKKGRKERTGMDVLNWLEEQVFTKGFVPPPVIYVHTMNPEKGRVMRQVVERIQCFIQNK